MKLDKYIVISGTPGVHRLVVARPGGVIIEDAKEKRTRFVATRQQQVMPLATIAIYTDTEDGSIPIADVFQRMLDKRETVPLPPVDANSEALREYFAQVLPEHDRYRVHIADIKKCLRWFYYMLEYGIFERLQREAAEEAASEGAEQSLRPDDDKTETA